MPKLIGNDHLKIDVALVPDQARSWRNTIGIVVDVLRASSTIVTLFDKGASLIYPVTNKRQGLRVARAQVALLCGDTKIFPPQGFDLENSPDEISRLDFLDRKITICTMNGSKVLSRLSHLQFVLVGSFLNAEACSFLALNLLNKDITRIGIICAGNDGEFALDDCVCAGYLVSTLTKQLAERHTPYYLTESSICALRLEQSYDNVADAFADTASGGWLAAHDQEADMIYCGQKNISQVAPILSRSDLIHFIR